MKIQNLRKKTEGFTIIEVLIVLAIAGLIMLIVFLAVPALQRNQRNTQRTSDVSRVGTGVQNWVSNNNGAVFTAGVSNANLTAVMNDVGNLGQYTLVAGTNFKVLTGAQSAMPTLANIFIVTGAQCGANGATVANSNTRLMAVQYATETSGGGTTGQALCKNI